jgi:NAD(P)-dependent dehydrogenase (short-subunit alcohol dehydrogenase family)
MSLPKSSHSDASTTLSTSTGFTSIHGLNGTNGATTIPHLPDFALSGSVLVVTGGGRGLGLAQTQALLEAGAAVYVLDRLEEPDPHFTKLQMETAARGGRLLYRRVDVTDEASVHKLFADIVEAEGRLDGLLAAAGIQQETPALEYTAADFRRMLDVNVVGVFVTAQAAARQMKALGTGGAIAFIASMSGTVANRDLLCCAYNSSKAAVLQLARNLATEWGQYGIRVNTLSPGYIATAMTEQLFETHPHRRAEWSTQNPLGRISGPDEFRGAAVFLMSKASAFMTGADLRIDGGHACW